MGRSQSSWGDMSSEEAYRLSQAEFKGMVVQALQDIRGDISDIKSQQNTTRYISMVIAGLSGIVASILAVLGIRTFVPPTGP